MQNLEGSFHFCVNVSCKWKSRVQCISFIIVLSLQVLDDPAEDNLHMGTQAALSSR